VSIIRSAAIGCGRYLPEKILTNDELATMVDTSNEWIVQRTGITARHIAAEGETTSDLGTKAALAALENAGKIQHNLGIKKGAAFDVQAVCSGFVFAMSTADTYICAGKAKRVLVIGAETFSRILDWEDRTTCVLFGDARALLCLRRLKAKAIRTIVVS